MITHCPECGSKTETVFVLTIGPSILDTLKRKHSIKVYACDECLLDKLTIHLSKSKRLPIKVGVLK
jgi:hypothetical protein